MDIFSKLFGKEKKKQNAGTLSAGERWELKDKTANPWEGRPFSVVIRDCKNGWVLFSRGGPMPSQTLRVEEFKSMYEPSNT